MDNEKMYITIKEASQMFGIGQNTLRLWCKEYADQFVLFIGSKQLINKNSFSNFLEQSIKEKKVLETY